MVGRAASTHHRVPLRSESSSANVGHHCYNSLTRVDAVTSSDWFTLSARSQPERCEPEPELDPEPGLHLPLLERRGLQLPKRSFLALVSEASLTGRAARLATEPRYNGRGERGGPFPHPI